MTPSALADAEGVTPGTVFALGGYAYRIAHDGVHPTTIRCEVSGSHGWAYLPPGIVASAIASGAPPLHPFETPGEAIARALRSVGPV